MLTKLSLSTLLACFLTIFFCTPEALATTIELKLKDGSTVSGKVLAEDASSYRIGLGASEITILKADVDTLSTTSSTAAVERSQSLKTQASMEVTAPARPEIRGKKLKGAGITMVLAGGLASAGFGYMAFGENDSGFTVPFGVGVSVAVTGLVVAIVGRKQETNSEAEQEEWDAKYGETQALTQWTIYPIVAEGGGGLGFQASF